MQQFDTAINTGTVDPEKLFQNWWKNWNLKVLTKSIEEMQKQYDEFLKSKKS